MVDEPEADVYSEYNAAYDPDDPWAARRAGLADHWNGMPSPNLTDFCPGTTERCGDTCASEELDCFLVDEHGVVVADETGLQAGRRLSVVNEDLMVRLEAAKVFQRVTVSDYQGVCRRAAKSAARSTSAVSNATTTPDLLEALKPLRVNKTTLQLCSVKVDLHRLGPGLRHRQSSPLSCEKRSFAAAAVPGTNLVLLTALNNCPQLEQLEPFATEPWEATSRKGEPVFRKQGLLWPRRRPPTACYREHVGERNITQCGGAHRDRALHLAVLAALAALPLLAASA
ncbi:hypothetical protein FOCC_FOCC017364 [Frankliniella occidentalis]|nr:hypothetical protein FOCC_FOCC017364 [Frankliniella occidentalis]